MGRRNLERDFFLGFIRIHILRHASSAPVFGSELAGELAGHGYPLSFGTLYPILHGLESEELLLSESRITGGRVRKYYRITDRGRGVLLKAKVLIRELVNEVLTEDEEMTRESRLLGEAAYE